MTQAFWHVRNCSLFQRLNESQLARLEQQARLRKFPKGAAIYLPQDVADAALLLAEGRVRIVCNTPDGKQSILALIEPGELFGELAIIDSAPREERAEAMTGSTVVFLPGDHLRQLMEECSGLALGVTKLIGMRRKRVERRLRSLLFRSNRERLTQLLVDLAEQYGNPTTAGIELRIRLSHQDLASIIGATRETVTTVLGELQSEGLVLIGRQKLVLLDLPRLARNDTGSPASPTAENVATPAVRAPHTTPQAARSIGKATR